MKNSYERPRGLVDDYEIIFIDRFCRRQCFKSYGGCSSSPERQVIDINEIINQIQNILKRKPKAKIFLDAPNFVDVDYRMEIPGEKENQHIKLLRTIIKSGIKAHFRIDTTVYSLLDKKSYFYQQILRTAGIKEVWLGVESGNEELRDKYNKPFFTNKELKQITQNLHKEKILCCWYLIVGFEDTNQTINETVALVKEIKPDRIFLSQLLPYEPGEQFIDFEKLKSNIAKIEKYRRIFQNLAKEIEKK